MPSAARTLNAQDFKILHARFDPAALISISEGRGVSAARSSARSHGYNRARHGFSVCNEIGRR